jgi:hypothetical protein
VRVPTLAFCAAAFATSFALVAPRAAATTLDSPFPLSEPKASSEVPFPLSDPKASEVPFPRSEPKASGEVHQAYVGRYCTPTGCAGAPSPAGQAASFGTAAATILFLARRRRA